MVAESRGVFVYAPPGCVEGESIRLPPEEAHHLLKVRRIAPREDVFATDGEGMVYRCRAESGNRLVVLERLAEFGEPRVQIELLVGVLKGDGNRDVVDGAVQLGVRRVILVHCARCEAQLSPNKLERLRRTTVGAIKQCGRARLPRIETVGSVSQALDVRDTRTKLLLAQLPGDGPSEPVRLNAADSFGIVVGPEGGLEPSETDEILAAGAQRLCLGERRLRTGSAVSAAVSFVLAAIGEYRAY